MRVRDSGLAAVYDRYADHLYTYCRFLLGEPADAVDAVEDAFLVAVERLPGPPEDEWLRPWLFAVARNACLSRLQSGQAASAFDSAFDDAAGGDTDHALLRAAMRGLSSAERDIIGMLWHGLDVAEIASVLGVSRDDALSLFSRARDQLELCAVTLVVTRAGRGSCQGLDAVLGDWDGRLTVPLARKLGKHIDHCEACGTLRREELRPGLLLRLTPGALLGAAITDEALRRAAVSTRLLRRQALGTAADPSPEAAAIRAMACKRQGTFGEGGFPKPLGTAATDGLRWRRWRIGLAAAGVAAAAAVLVAVVSGGAQSSRTASAGAGPTGLAQSGGGIVSAVSGTRPSSGVSSASGTPGPSLSASPSPSVSPSATASKSASPRATPSSGGAASSSSAKPTSAPPPPASGTLSVPSSVRLQAGQGGQWPPGWQGTLTVTVSGGSLSWSVAADQGLTFSQASGSASATIAITGRGTGNFPPISISAGGTTYQVEVMTNRGGGW
jgi:RNA polymerase sigma factor (sigma-70 family)